MKKIALVTFREHLNNEIFVTTDPLLNIDGLLEPFRILRNQLFKLGFDLSTYDINSIDESDFVFYFHLDDNTPYPKIENKEKSFFFIWECEIITPQFYDKELHKYFNKIFTFRDDLVDNVKYFKINYSFNIPSSIDKNLSNKTKLCTLIAGHKLSSDKLELYSERIRAIRWFESNHPDEFDLYGRGWNSFISNNMLVRKICNKLPVVKKMIEKYIWNGYPSYKGEIVSKIEVLKKYKFSICYENARDIPGYITEKIQHCFFAGCVPIYWGANNITDYIPGNCFIDKRDFNSYEELYAFIDNISDEVYLEYLNNIENYITSELAEAFSVNKFVSNTLSEVVG